MEPSIAWKAPSLSFGIYGPTVAVFLSAACVGGLSTFLSGTQASSKKPYASFTSFYPFYLTQHTQRTTKLLHAVGTSFVLTAIYLRPHLGLALLAAATAGSVSFPFFRHMDSGLFEFLVAASAYSTVGHSLNIPKTFLIGAPISAYFFAWVSHFFIEKNKPATFIYPVFSLLGDFRMMVDLVTGRIQM